MVNYLNKVNISLTVRNSLSGGQLTTRESLVITKPFPCGTSTREREKPIVKSWSTSFSNPVTSTLTKSLYSKKEEMKKQRSILEKFRAFDLPILFVTFEMWFNVQIKFTTARGTSIFKEPRSCVIAGSVSRTVNMAAFPTYTFVLVLLDSVTKRHKHVIAL